MISVCIPVYNGEKYIKEQLDSILKQLSISDDYSTDNTLKIIRELDDERIKIYSHNLNKNPYHGTYKKIYRVACNVENALIHASGDYVFLADQDDIWFPNKVERIMQEFMKGADCILHNNIVIDDQHNILLDSYFSIMRPSLNLIRIFLKCPFQGACMAFRQQIAERALPFPNNPISHDHWIAYNAYFRKDKIVFISEPLLYYRRHGNNVSPSSEKSPNSLYFKVNYRFRLLYAAWKVIFNRNTCC